MKVFDGWHHFCKVIDKFGKKSLYLDGHLGSYLPELCFDEVRISNVARNIRIPCSSSENYLEIKSSNEKIVPPYTIDYWMRINFSLKHWSEVQKYSFSTVCKRI